MSELIHIRRINHRTGKKKQYHYVLGSESNGELTARHQTSYPARWIT
jgi:hypothetical protein